MFARPQVDRLFVDGLALTRFQSLDAFSFGTADDLDECHICSRRHFIVCWFSADLAGRDNGIAAGACDAKQTYDNRKWRESAASLYHGQGLQGQLTRTRTEEGPEQSMLHNPV